jgi:hypothetical protein
VFGPEVVFVEWSGIEYDWPRELDSSAVGYSKVDIDFQEYKEYNTKSISNKSTDMNMAHHQELGSICLP